MKLGKLALSELTPPVLFKNAQWAVTGYGIEQIGFEDWESDNKHGYYVEKLALYDRHISRSQDTGLPHWPFHMASKNWVDIDLFIEAFAKAIEVYPPREPFASGWLETMTENCRHYRRVLYGDKDRHPPLRRLPSTPH